MKLLIRSLLITSLLLGFSYGLSWGLPTIPETAIQSSQEIGQCESGLILRYQYDLPDGGNIVIFKQPNKEAAIYLRWNPGNSGDADEIWVNEQKLTAKELYDLYPTPCAVFDAMKT